MSQKKVAELSGIDLDKAVAAAARTTVYWNESDQALYYGDGKPNSMGLRGDHPFGPTEDWAIAGKIITENAITIEAPTADRPWVAHIGMNYEQEGATPLEAAMRTFVCSAVGERAETVASDKCERASADLGDSELVSIWPWDSSVYHGGSDDQGVEYRAGLFDQRSKNGQIHLEIAAAQCPEASAALHLCVEIGSVTPESGMVPAAHIMFGDGNLAFSVFSDARGELVIRPENCVQFTPDSMEGTRILRVQG